MSCVYLIRHGQAGTRDAYDSLSELGREQARRLGEFFARQNIRFERAHSGAMRRHRATAAEAAEAYRRLGLEFPPVEERPDWNEFDLDDVYREIAPLLAVEDAEFRREYESLREAVRASRGDGSADVHRRWSPCDVRVVDAWIRGRYPYSGESWRDFCARISSLRPSLDGAGDANIAVFTSATPAAILTGLAMEIEDARVMRLAGVMYNTAFTTLRVRGDQIRLLSFNNAPHLSEPRLRTHR
ncbi:MAG TPA: histidine phosphatase family protein [Bryobacteraceae bacterium]|nr:histidine phosphatase family protein [Bryobacteraceae bacterium]